ncbi:uncharacterized protein VICG_01513 [Vittaforma corneae ATCC 50505]|uniref:Uncharacterized protein n=1 Tax=Vittaforma corneae (strain ATCC 50505) TaxID=993615 RepID=L2GKJ8_VITCO|nr:uncharacterized protein VICG_01513 [Vittaforma corneae ATCC 50505]ELA41408.1 hypothetical protein VICG_01513 [Vittaforma corneae ATCC 50505]
MLYLLVQLGNILADKAVYQNYGEYGNLLTNPYNDSMDSIVNNPGNSSRLLDLLSGTIDLPNNVTSADELKNQSNLQKSNLKEHEEEEHSQKSKLNDYNSIKMKDDDSSDDESQKSETKTQKNNSKSKRNDTKSDNGNMSDSEDD